MDLNFIIPGHYKLRGTELSEKESTEIIRVLGESDTKENFFKLQDGREFHESHILTNYEYIATIATADTKLSKVKLGDLSAQSPTNVNTSIEPEESSNETTWTRTPEQSIKTKLVFNNQEISEPLNQEELFNRTLLDKFKSPNINSYKITIDLDIVYDLTKIREANKLFDLDLNQISKIIYDLSKQSILTSIKEYLTNEPIENVHNQEITPTKEHLTITQQDTTVKESVQKLVPEIEEDINELDDEITKLLQKHKIFP